MLRCPAVATSRVRGSRTARAIVGLSTGRGANHAPYACIAYASRMLHVVSAPLFLGGVGVIATCHGGGS